jgi:hypothetical protein
MGKTKRFADTTDPPVVIPVVLIAVAVHVALVVPPVERGKITQNIFYTTTL